MGLSWFGQEFFFRGNLMTNQKLPGRKMLEALYWEEKMTQAAIGLRYGVTGAAVGLALKRLGIPTRHGPPISEIQYHYLDQKMSTTVVGRLYDCSAGSIRYHLKKHGVKMRTCQEAMVLRRKLPSDAELLRLYWDEEMSFAMIGKRYNVLPGVVSSAFIYRKLATRTRLEAARLRARKARGRKLPCDAELVRLYWDKEMSQAMIAKQFGTTAETVQQMFKRRGIKTRTQAEAGKLRHRREQQR